MRTLIGMLAVAAVTSILQAQEPIALERPREAGQKFKVKCEYTETESTKYLGEPKMKTETSTRTLTLDGTFTVYKVTELGGPSKAQLTVGSLQSKTRATGASSGQNLAPGGASFVGEVKGRAVSWTAVQGGENQQAQQALRDLISLHGDSPDLDALFPTQKRHKVEDSWPADTAFVVKYLAGMGLAANPDKIKGQAKIKSETKVGDVDCFEIEMQLTINDPTQTNAPPVPAAFGRLSSLELEVTWTKVLPKNLSLIEQSEDLKLFSRAIYVTRNPIKGGDLEIMKDTVAKRRTTFEPVK